MSDIWYGFGWDGEKPTFEEEVKALLDDGQVDLEFESEESQLYFAFRERVEAAQPFFELELADQFGVLEPHLLHPEFERYGRLFRKELIASLLADAFGQQYQVEGDLFLDLAKTYAEQFNMSPSSVEELKLALRARLDEIGQEED